MNNWFLGICIIFAAPSFGSLAAALGRIADGLHDIGSAIRAGNRRP